MKKIGIIGGVGRPSTADCHRLIGSGANAHFRRLGHPPPPPSPPIMIAGLNMAGTGKLRDPPGPRSAGSRHHRGNARETTRLGATPSEGALN